MVGRTVAELKKLARNDITAADLRDFPGMTGWFEPVLLMKLLWRVVVADAFGQYADRRLMEAALDHATVKQQSTRAKADALKPDTEGAVWIDYVSDLGDGFDATYAIAYLLAQPSLAIDGQELPRGGMLFMGGDEVYPTAARDDYILRLQRPYEFARPPIRGKTKTPLYVLPGNHDWYDGLVNFLAIFCRAKRTLIGGWETRQRRSYFAVKITEEWWLWGIDIALVRDMDQPQADYFVGIASEMPEGASIILCSAEPGWYKAEADGDAFRTVSYAAGIANDANRNLNIPLILSGDSHHYARYEAEDAQYITSGGGGAFLHGTLDLLPRIKAVWKNRQPSTLTLKGEYPDKPTSIALLAGTAQFGARNPGLGWVFGGFYLLCAFLIQSIAQWETTAALSLLLFGGLLFYIGFQEKSWSWKFAGVAAAHAAAHMLAIWGIVGLFLLADLWLGCANWPWWLRLALLAVPALTIGKWAAGKIFGYHLLVTCRYLNMNHNDAFSAMRLDSHRHFLRLKIQHDRVTVFPVKLEIVPSRDQWKRNEDDSPGASIFVAVPPLAPQFIEPAIVIATRDAQQTGDVKPASELPPRS